MFGLAVLVLGLCVGPSAGASGTALLGVPLTDADLGLSVIDAPDPVTAEGTVAHTFQVTNAGPTTATLVELTVTLDPSATFVSAVPESDWVCGDEASGVVTCTLATLGVETSPDVVVTSTAPAEAGSLTTQGTVQAVENDPLTDDNSVSEDTTVDASANLSIVKGGPASIDAGGSIAYTLDVANAGPSTATGVEVTDQLPSGVAYQIATGTGWTCDESTGVVTCTLDAGALPVGPASTIDVLATAPAEPTTLTNQASVSSTTSDPNAGNDTSSVQTDVTPVADLSITKDGPATVAAGKRIRYTLDVSNAGPSTATNVVATDDLPAGTTFVSAVGTGWVCGHDTGTVTCDRGSLAVGPAPTITIRAGSPAEPTSLTNEASVTSDADDPDPGDDTSSAQTDVSASANLSLTKSGPSSVVAGQQFSYTLAVSNAGPSTASGLSVTDDLPAGTTYVSATGTGWICSHLSGTVTCARASLAVGSAPTITIAVQAPNQPGTIVNEAMVTATTADPIANNDDDQVSTTVTASADLSLDKSGPASMVAGTQVQYSLSVTNAGPSTATSVEVVDDLPAQTTFVSATGAGWDCDHVAGFVTCTRPTLIVKAAPVITITVAPAQTLKQFTNTAEVGSAVPDPVPGNDDDAVTTTQTRNADLAVSATGAAPNPVRVGAPVTYGFGIANAGPTTAIEVGVEIDLPNQSVFASAASTKGSCAHSGGLVTCNLGAMVAGSGASITVVATPTGPGAKPAEGVAAHEGDDPDATDDADTGQVTAEGLTCTNIGSQGPDTISSGPAANVVCGLGGSDTIDAGDGNDFVYAGSGDDDVTGGSGGDSINGQAGNDAVAGAAGFDYARYDGAAAGVTGNLATGTVTGGDGTDTLSSIEGFVGSRFADVLTGDGLDNIIEGGKGNDTIDGAGGSDAVSSALATGGVTISLATGSTGGADGTDALSRIEDIFGSPFADTLTGSSVRNSIHGLGGNDAIIGGGDFDFARYSSAPSGVNVDLALGTASGGHGADSLTGIEGAAGSPFADTLKGDGDVNTLIGGGGADTLNGGANSDSASYSAAPGPVAVDLAAQQATGADGNDTLVSIEGAFGSAFGDTLTGSAGADQLDGLGGPDLIAAAGGNDNVWGGTGNDEAAGGGGFDYLRFENAPAGVTVSIRDGAASGGDGADSLTGFEGVTGSAFGDRIGGSSADEALYGRNGNDTLSGERGADDLFGEGGNDLLKGGDGGDDLFGGPGNDDLNGGKGTDSCVQGDGSGQKTGCETSRWDTSAELVAPATIPPSGDTAATEPPLSDRRGD